MIAQDQIDAVGVLPCGYWYDLVIVSQAKRLLLDEMPLEYRARFLELVSKMERGLVTMEAISAVNPAPDAAMAMLKEMDHLSVDDKCRVMRRSEIFRAHIAINPSIADAIKLCRQYAIPEYRSA